MARNAPAPQRMRPPRSMLVGLPVLAMPIVMLMVGRAGAAKPNLPPGVEPTWKPLVYADAHVRECRTGIEIGYGAFDKIYGKDLAKATASAKAFIDRLNTYWTSEVMIQWTLAELIVRKTPGEDPHPDGTESGKIWGDTRALFIDQKKLDFGLKISTAMQGGLGGGRCAAIVPNGGMPWWAFDHEASHGFGLPHENGWPFERGPQNITNPLSIYGRIPRGFPKDPGDAPGLWYGKGEDHTFSAKNVEDMRRDVGGLKNLGPCARPLPPYAAMDIVRVPVGAKSPAKPVKVLIDVLANDHDCNNGPIWIRSFDPNTPQGIAVTRVVGGGPGRRDVLNYALPDNVGFSFHDLFDYTIVDQDGLVNRGHVLVIVETPNLLVNGSFEFGPKNWKRVNATLVPINKAQPKAGWRLCLAGGTAASARQAVPLKPASHYRLTLSCTIPKGEKLVLCVAGEDDKLPPTITKDLTKGWMTRVLYFSTDANAKGGTIVIERPAGGTGDILVDEVELRQVGPKEADEYAKEWPNEDK